MFVMEIIYALFFALATALVVMGVWYEGAPTYEYPTPGTLHVVDMGMEDEYVHVVDTPVYHGVRECDVLYMQAVNNIMAEAQREHDQWQAQERYW